MSKSILDNVLRYIRYHVNEAIDKFNDLCEYPWFLECEKRVEGEAEEKRREFNERRKRLNGADDKSIRLDYLNDLQFNLEYWLIVVKNVIEEVEKS